MAVLHENMSMNHLHAVYTEAGRHWITWNWSCSFKLPGRWQSNQGPLKEQPVLLTSELSLHPHLSFSEDIAYKASSSRVHRNWFIEKKTQMLREEVKVQTSFKKMERGWKVVLLLQRTKVGLQHMWGGSQLPVTPAPGIWHSLLNWLLKHLGSHAHTYT